MVNVEVLRDAEGRESFRVSRVFPNAASAEAGCHALERINPDGFVPVGHVVVGVSALNGGELLADGATPRPELVVDEDTIPGCPSGVCGLD